MRFDKDHFNSEVTSALMKFQQEVPNISLDAEIPYKNKRFKYATLGNIISTIKPTLKECGLMFTHFIADGKMVCEVHHVSGGYVFSTLDLPEVKSAQDLGAWITYLKRYSLTSLLGLVTEDDADGPKAPEPMSFGQASLIQTLIMTANLDGDILQRIDRDMESFTFDRAQECIKYLKNNQQQEDLRQMKGVDAAIKERVEREDFKESNNGK